MIEIRIPGDDDLKLEHLVLDYNGTLAFDGELLPRVKDTLISLATKIDVHVLTADTFGKVRDRLDGVACHVEIIPGESQDQEKLAYIEALGVENVASIGNGRNDRLMLKRSALATCLLWQSLQGGATDI